MKVSAGVLLLLACLVSFDAATREPVIGGPCDGCEAVFIEMPTQLSSSARISPVGQKGEPLLVEGTVRKADGAAARGIIVYAYQTDAGGIYPTGTTPHGKLRSWARTDAKGHYRFDTIRPGAYPTRDNPQHIHMHVIEPGKGTYYIDDVIFDDDPLLTAGHRQRMRRGRGGYGDSRPQRDAQGVWHVRRDVVLGKNIPGYGQ